MKLTLMEKSPASLSQYRTMKLIVYDELRSLIINGDYAPGSRLIAEHLGKRFGVSPTPVREALHRLEAEGLVKTSPHHGIEVSQFSVDEVIEIYHIRGALESLAARMAVSHLTPDDFRQMSDILNDMDDAVAKIDLPHILEVNRKFHALIWRAAQSPRLYDLLENFYDSSQRFRNASIRVPGRLEQISFEHRRIAQALQERNSSLAGQYTLDHYEGTAGNLLESIKPEAQNNINWVTSQ
jgi:DNA-binding GntR family transcriptional regulator